MEESIHNLCSVMTQPKTAKSLFISFFFFFFSFLFLLIRKLVDMQDGMTKKRYVGVYKTEVNTGGI